MALCLGKRLRVRANFDQVLNQRLWLMVGPIPFMEVESAWARVTALTPPADMSTD